MGWLGLGSKTPAKKRLLIAEDDDGIRSMFKAFLEVYEFDILEAEDGRQAVDIARKELPAVILMDAEMPRMDGWSASAILSRDPRTSHIPILMCTVHKRIADVERSLSMGVKDFIPKPVDLDQLLEKVRRVIQGFDLRSGK